MPELRLTKHAHACVALDRPGGHLLIDPGSFTPDARQLVADTAVVLITHEHPDHFDEELLAAALQDRPELKVIGPAAVVGRWDARPGQITAVAAGDRLTLEGFEVTVSGELHAEIHPDIPRCANVGYLVDGDVFHPGDAYSAPPVPVRTLLLPTSGPWTKVGEAVDFVRTVAPEQLVQIHEAMLSELGQQTMARFLSPQMLSTVPLTVVPVGATIDV